MVVVKSPEEVGRIGILPWIEYINALIGKLKEMVRENSVVIPEDEHQES